MLALLLGNAGDADVVNFKLRSLLHVASYEESLRCVQLLLKHSASVTAQVTFTPALPPIIYLQSPRVGSGAL